VAATTVLVHGGFLGAWIWDDVCAQLRDDEIDSVALDLPTVAEGGTFEDDVQSVRSALDRVPGPAILCGHSYAGMVITEAAAGPHPAVQRLVYLAAAVPDIGQGMTDLALASGTGGGAESVRARPDGLAELDPDSAAASLFNDCDPDRTAAAVAQLRPMNLAGAAGRVRFAAWRDVPATFVRGSSDKLPEMVTSGFWSVAPEVVVLPTGHCPSWSRADHVAGLLVERARGLD
jgi:pimeloyl-ACP methyl ester carboxylesterase